MIENFVTEIDRRDTCEVASYIKRASEGGGIFFTIFSNLGFEKGGFIGARANTITLYFEFAC
jgi:hypothetical protein